MAGLYSYGPVLLSSIKIYLLLGGLSRNKVLHSNTSAWNQCLAPLSLEQKMMLVFYCRLSLWNTILSCINGVASIRKHMPFSEQISKVFFVFLGEIH